MVDFFPAREVLLALFGLEIRWYGALYVAGFVLAYFLLPRLQKYRGLTLTRDEWNELLIWAMAGVLIGGRLGYVLFYEPLVYLAHPAQIIAIWNGGMSSHGGFIGVGVAWWYASRKLKVDVLRLLDVATVPVALGLALGRVGNFINQELYTNHAYPITKDVLIAAVSYVSLHASADYKHTLRQRRTFDWFVRPGSATIVFLLAYSVLRFLTEYVRIQQWPSVWGLTRGQILTVLLLFIGVWVVHNLQRASAKGQPRK